MTRIAHSARRRYDSSVKKRPTNWIIFLALGCFFFIGLHDKKAHAIEHVSITKEFIASQKGKPFATSDSSEAIFSSNLFSSDPKSYIYKIGIGDVLSIRLSALTIQKQGNVEYTQIVPATELIDRDIGFRVQDDGTIFFPFINRIKVAGKTLPELYNAFQKELSVYFREPQLEMIVSEFKSRRVLLTGAVEKPGEIFLDTEALTVLRAVEKVGGVTDSAQLKHATLQRNGIIYPIDIFELLEKGNNRFNILLEEQDILHIPEDEENVVFVMGEVIRPDMQQIGNFELTLAEALNNAQGFNLSTANKSEVYVIRGVDQSMVENEALQKIAKEQATIFHLDADSIEGLALADQFALQPRDIVYVSPRLVTQWGRFFSQLLPGGFATTTDPRRYE